MQKPSRRVGKLGFVTEWCKGCGYCIEFCPVKMLEFSDDVNSRGYHYPRIKKGMEEACIACRICENLCPDFAIYVESVKIVPLEGVGRP